MKIIEPSYEILTPIDGTATLKKLERFGRLCYKSEDKITEDSAEKFIENIIKRSHESILEHDTISIKFIHNRGFLAEVTRHRLASFTAESTRYIKYSSNEIDKELTFIQPYWFDDDAHCAAVQEYTNLMKDIERFYTCLTHKIQPLPPQAARGILTNDVKTEIVITTNLREWRHILKLRCSGKAHPDMQRVMRPLLKDLQSRIKVVFDDINY